MIATRVVQWATGTTGRLALKAVIAAPDLELVGVRVYSADKIGRDAGDLIDQGKTGVRATGTMQEVLALRPDVVLYMGRVETNRDSCFDEVTDLLAAGIDVIATGSTFVDPRAMAPEYASGMEAACKRGASTFLGVGLFPGFWGESLAPVLSRLTMQCEQLTVRESLSYAGYPSKELIFGAMGYGGAPDASDGLIGDPAGNPNPFLGTATVLAKRLGLIITSTRSFRETAVTDVDLHVKAGLIPAGTVGAMKLGVRAECGPVTIVVEHVTWMSPDVAPEWARREGYEIEFGGQPSLRCHLELGIHGEDHTDMGCLATAMHAVHAIGAVLAAPPGLLDLADLPDFIGQLA
jgi:2,4-diaminopentanoate dehydrogenase